MTVEWTAALETGIPQIDRQHQELVGMINEMESALVNAETIAVLNDILPRLKVYAMFHFGEEEVLLAQAAEGTEFAEHHHQEHQNFVRELERLVASRSQQSDEELAEVLMMYLADWLVLHISGTDRTLARMLLDRATPAQALVSIRA